MSSQSKCNCGPAMSYVIAVLGTFVIVAGLVVVMRSYTQPAPLAGDRALERKKALATLRQEEANALANYAWQNEGKGIIHLPIEQAKKLALGLAAKGPAGLRTEVINRVEKFNKPVSFE